MKFPKTQKQLETAKRAVMKHCDEGRHLTTKTAVQSEYERLTGHPAGMRRYQQERVILEITEMLCAILDKQGVTRKELGKRLGKSERYVDDLLDGQYPNIRQLTDAFTALNHRLVLAHRRLVK